jgi:hypothetical protein
VNAGVSRAHSNVAVESGELNEKLAALDELGFEGDDEMLVSGTTVSIDHVKLAGVPSTFPAASLARTLNVCEPSTSVEYGFGLVQGVNVRVSRAHSNVAVASGEVKLKLAVVALVVAAGLAVMLVSGATVSTVHVKLAGVPSTFPAASLARTLNVCEPSTSVEYGFGLVQAVNAGVSRAHSNEAVASGDVNEKLAELAVVTAAGLAVMFVSGATVSIVHVEDVTGPMLLSASRALTRKVWLPSGRPLYVFGLEQLE